MVRDEGVLCFVLAHGWDAAFRVAINRVSRGSWENQLQRELDDQLLMQRVTSLLDVSKFQRSSRTGGCSV